jgi:prophage regulatory protein
MTRRFLRCPVVRTRTGLPKSTLYQLIADGKFPKQIRIGPRAVVWLEEDVDAWIDSKVAEAGATKPTGVGDVVVNTPRRPASVKDPRDNERLSR